MQRLVVRVTCPSDPFFYYSLVLPEEDFATLKAQQVLSQLLIGQLAHMCCQLGSLGGLLLVLPDGPGAAVKVRLRGGRGPAKVQTDAGGGREWGHAQLSRGQPIQVKDY